MDLNRKNTYFNFQEEGREGKSLDRNKQVQYV